MLQVVVELVQHQVELVDWAARLVVEVPVVGKALHQSHSALGRHIVFDLVPELELAKRPLRTSAWAQ